jgi:hypothetical protein
VRKPCDRVSVIVQLVTGGQGQRSRVQLLDVGEARKATRKVSLMKMNGVRRA